MEDKEDSVDIFLDGQDGGSTSEELEEGCEGFEEEENSISEKTAPQRRVSQKRVLRWRPTKRASSVKSTPWKNTR